LAISSWLPSFVLAIKAIVLYRVIGKPTAE